MYKRLAILVLVAITLVGCNLGGQEPPTPFPTVPPPAVEAGRSSRGDVVASGALVPAQQAQLSFTIPGRVEEVAVALGDQVQAGELLVALETASLEAQVAQAEAAVGTAMANLARLAAGARPQEIGAGETAVALARAQVSQAQAALEAAKAQCAAARSGIEAAQAALEAAQAQSRQLDTGPRAGQVAAAEEAVELAETSLQQAQAAYDRVKSSPDIQMRPEALALQQATIAHRAAQAQYQALFQGTTLEQKQTAAAQVRAAEVQVTQAGDQALAACALVGQASAAVEAAQAGQAQAEQQLSLLEAGATAEEIAIAQAQVGQAEAALQGARVALEQAALRAPAAGTVSGLVITAGETVVPGQTVLSLADLTRLRAETNDLSERDVARVAPGQEALVYVEALGEEIRGRVTGIAPQATTIGGDVVYTIFVDLEEQPPGLRWGMSAEVEVINE